MCTGCPVVTDETLRLPTIQFRAVLDLGECLAAAIPLPEALGHPDLFADWGDDGEALNLSVDFEDGQLHIVLDDTGPTFHFHGNEDPYESPWPQTETETLLQWALTLAQEIYTLEDLLDSIADAADWFEQGFTLYVPETDPTQLELIELGITGELLTLPWLGSGTVDHEHIDGDHHPIALVWTPVPGAMASRLRAPGWTPPRGSRAPRPCPEWTGTLSRWPRTKCSPGCWVSTPTTTWHQRPKRRSCARLSSAWGASAPVPSELARIFETGPQRSTAGVSSQV